MLNEMREILKIELSRQQNFDNWHGISKESIYKHLVEPYEVDVFGEGKVDPVTRMSVVPKEREAPTAGYLIAYEKVTEEWCLIEMLKDGTYYCDTAGDSSLFEALSNM